MNNKAMLSHTCPACGQHVPLVAAARWLEPAQWDFWGKPGRRFLVAGCQTDTTRHFYVTMPGGIKSHRLVWLED